MNRRINHYGLWLECIAVFVVIPVLIWSKVIFTPLIMLPVVIISLPAGVWLARKYGISRALFWSGDSRAECKHLKTIIGRFLLNGVLLFAVLLVWYPDHLFDLPSRMTGFWLTLIVIYPLLSVYPQEFLYRAFFFHRYRDLFQNPQYLVIWNAVLFGWMHIVLHNLLSVALSVVAGLLFADTYRKTRSLRLTCLEHSLYGILIFSLGYAEAFIYKPWLTGL